jgi:hypothetical protein
LESRIDKPLSSTGVIPVKIFAINKKVDEHNLICFNQNPNKIVSFYAKDTGEQRHKDSLDKNCLAPKVLNLKIGAQVMLLSNLDAEEGWVNGTIGVISKFEDNSPVLKTRDGKTCIITKSKWEIKEQIIEEPIKKPIQNGGNVNTDTPTAQPANAGSRLSFNDIDYIKTQDGLETSIIAPKNIQRLEQLSEERNQQRKLENDDDDTDKIKISDQPYTLSNLDIHTIEEPKIDLFPDLLQDIEILE